MASTTPFSTAVQLSQTDALKALEYGAEHNIPWYALLNDSKMKKFKLLFSQQFAKQQQPINLKRVLVPSLFEEYYKIIIASLVQKLQTANNDPVDEYVQCLQFLLRRVNIPSSMIDFTTLVIPNAHRFEQVQYLFMLIILFNKSDKSNTVVTPEHINILLPRVKTEDDMLYLCQVLLAMYRATAKYEYARTFVFGKMMHKQTTVSLRSKLLQYVSVDKLTVDMTYQLALQVWKDLLHDEPYDAWIDTQFVKSLFSCKKFDSNYSSKLVFEDFKSDNVQYCRRCMFASMLYTQEPNNTKYAHYQLDWDMFALKALDFVLSVNYHGKHRSYLTFALSKIKGEQVSKLPYSMQAKFVRQLYKYNCETDKSIFTYM